VVILPARRGTLQALDLILLPAIGGALSLHMNFSVGCSDRIAKRPAKGTGRED
jgi:hypothetical protein